MSDYRESLVTYVGATGRTLTIYIKRDGVAYDLTGKTGVTIAARDGGESGTVVVDDETMTVDADPTTGVVTWTPSAGAVDTAGKFDCQVRVEVTSGKYDFADPVWLEVKPSIIGSGA